MLTHPIRVINTSNNNFDADHHVRFVLSEGDSKDELHLYAINYLTLIEESKPAWSYWYGWQDATHSFSAGYGYGD